MKQDTQNGIKLVNANADQMQVFLITNNVGIMMNADVNVKHWLTNEYLKKDLYGTLANVNVNEKNHMTLENI